MPSHQNEYGNQQGRLPFQQINPSHETYKNTENLLQERIQERSSLDNVVNNKSQSQSQSQSQTQTQTQTPQPQIQDSMVKRFLSMTTQEKESLSQMNPSYYQQLLAASQTYNSIQTHAQLNSQPFAQFNSQPQSQFTPQSQFNPAQAKTQNFQQDFDVRSDVSSDLENIHSSDEEVEDVSVKTKHINPKDRKLKLNLSSVNKTNQNIVVNQGSVFLSLDFRNDMVEIKNDISYLLKFPKQHNVTGLELESCLINRNKQLEREPYIYINISEIEGEYQVTAGHQIHSVFGKLIQEKTINEFIVYKPENCIKNFLKQCSVDTLSVKFLKYDLSPIHLNKIQVDRVRKNKDYIKVTTRHPHYLAEGDYVNISSSGLDRISVDTVEILKVPSSETLILEPPTHEITSGNGLQFEKVNLKCTLTFKIFS